MPPIFPAPRTASRFRNCGVLMRVPSLRFLRAGESIAGGAESPENLFPFAANHVRKGMLAPIAYPGDETSYRSSVVAGAAQHFRGVGEQCRNGLEGFDGTARAAGEIDDQRTSAHTGSGAR
jgi:hypothetical protein